ncbi:MAG: C45 family peptidase [Bdellovibrionota bacterium]
MRRVIFWLAIFAMARSLAAVEVPSSIKQKYAYLYRLPVTTNADGSKSFHNGRLFLREGIRVLALKGDRFEMGFQHGRLLHLESQRGALAMAPKLVPNIIENTYSGKPLMKVIAKRYVDNFVTGKLTQHLIGMGGDSQLADAYGISEGAHVALDDVVQGLLNPDVLMILAARNLDSEESMISSPSHCSDFAVWGDYTEDGELIIGRNMDFGLNGYYDRYPTVIYFDSTEDDIQKYMAIISAGVHNAGFQAINESGIFVGVHTIPTTETNMEGVPAFLLASEVIRHAKTFDEAADIFKLYHVPSGYAYTLVSTREKKAAAVELSGAHTFVRMSSGGKHIQTNQYLSPEMEKKNLYINHSVDEDSIGRYKRIEAMLESQKPLAGPKEAMQVLGDKVDVFSANGTARSIGNTVAVHTSITSLVYLPAQGKVFVANGMAPTSQSTFVEFPSIEEFSVESFPTSAYEKIENDDFKKEYPNKALAEQAFIQAKMAYEYHDNVPAARASLRQATGLETDNPFLFILQGIFELKMGYLGEAQKAFRLALQSQPARHQKQLAQYYLGRIYAHWGYTGSALQQFYEVLNAEEADPKLFDAALVAYQKTRKWVALSYASTSLR